MNTTGGEVNFWDHVSSLRAHLLWAFGFFIGITGLIFSFFSDLIISSLLLPLQGVPLVFLTPMGPFLFKLQISAYSGVIVFIPIFLVILLHFVFPALLSAQKKGAVYFAVASCVFTLLSVLATYFYVIPYTLDFLLSLVVPGTSFMLTAESYIKFFILEIIVSFMLLQIPLLIIMAGYLKLINPKVLKKQRRLIYLVLLAVLAIATPTTDALTLVMVFIPAVLLVEVGLAIAEVMYDN